MYSYHERASWAPQNSWLIPHQDYRLLTYTLCQDCPLPYRILCIYIDLPCTRVVFWIFKQPLTPPQRIWKPGIFRSLECLSYLDLKNNDLTTLPVAFLQGVGSAYYKGQCGDNGGERELRLEVDGSRTSYLKPGSSYLYQYNQLYLENMNLTELPAGVFDGLEYLHGLHLQGNKLRTLPEGLFWNLSNLSELHLQGNKLRTLPEGLFRNLSSLEKLDLQGNKLRTLPEGLLRNLSGLRSLYLQNNGLEELPSSVCAWVSCGCDISPIVVVWSPDFYRAIGCVGWRFESVAEEWYKRRRVYWDFARLRSCLEGFPKGSLQGLQGLRKGFGGFRSHLEEFRRCAKRYGNFTERWEEFRKRFCWN